MRSLRILAAAFGLAPLASSLASAALFPGHDLKLAKSDFVEAVQ